MTALRERWLLLLAVVGGLLVVGVLVVVPVHARFGDDPMLRLQGFDRQRSFLPTDVSCGSAVSTLDEPIGSRPLYDVARDDACHEAGVRRVWVALAAGAVLAAGGMAGLAAAAARDA
ncbi:MAG: hypothetical protein ABR511_15360 [Acidimicrobiales bacterium]